MNGGLKRRAKTAAWGWCLIMLGQVATAGTVDGREDRVDALFDNYDGEKPGAAVIVIKDGQIVYEKGFGLAALGDSRELATELTNFRLASVSKAFTAFAIMILKDRGALNYDTTLTEIFADFPEYGSRITIRHLLGHTSGLRNYEDLMYQYPAPKPIKDRDVLQLMTNYTRSTLFTPGSSYRYSNTGYVLLAQIVEHLSGMRFSEFLAAEVFAPLGMENTVAFENGLNDVQNRAYGHAYRGGRYVDADQSDTSSTLGDGGVYCSVREMFLWDQAWYGNTLVSAETLHDAMTPGQLNNGRATEYGFGWVIGSYRGVPSLTHTGSTTGFRTAFQRYPDKELSVVVLVNRDESSPWDIAQSVADIYWN